MGDGSLLIAKNYGGLLGKAGKEKRPEYRASFLTMNYDP